MAKTPKNAPQKGQQGFQKIGVTPVSPTGTRGFLGRMMDKLSGGKADTPVYAPPSDPNDPWAWATDSSAENPYSSVAVPKTQPEPVDASYLPDDVTDEYRFGPHAVEHAKIDTARRAVLESLKVNESYVWTGDKGQDQTVTHNFNPTRVFPHLQQLAYKVLSESGYFDRKGETKYRGVPGVYSDETIACAVRIYESDGKTTFRTPKYEGESTSIFPCEVKRSDELVAYTYYTHQDVGKLLSNVEKEQLKSEKLQKEIREHTERRQASKAKFDSVDW